MNKKRDNIIFMKNYWIISKRNFIALTVLQIIVGLMFITTEPLIITILMFLFAGLFFYIANLYSKKSKYAYISTYIVFGISFVLTLVTSISRSDIGGLVAIIVTFYILYCARKAQLQVSVE